MTTASMRTIRWGMIGCGAVCEVKSGPGFCKADHSMLLAASSADPSLTRSYAQRHGVPRAYDTVDELLRDPDVDAVYVATPPSLHKPLSLQAARAGKHVYVEKPMALRFEECAEIIAECERVGRRLFVAFYRRAMPRFLQVKQWIDEGSIGEVRCISAFQHQRPAPEDLSRETLPWRLKPEVAGGGKFLDMGVHTLDFFDFVFGPIVEVRGIATNQAGLYDVEDTVNAAWRHAGGVTGVGSWCYVCNDPVDRVEIVGAKGRIEFEFFTDAPLRLVTGEGLREVAIANPAHVQQPFIQTIVDELIGLGRCPGDPESAARSTFVADAILESYRIQHGYR